MIGNCVSVAQYEVAAYTVRFFDGLGNSTPISTQTVISGQSATAPTLSTSGNYTFSAWNKSFTNITSDTDVYAIWSYEFSDSVTTSNKTEDITFYPGTYSVSMGAGAGGGVWSSQSESWLSSSRKGGACTFTYTPTSTETVSVTLGRYKSGDTKSSGSSGTIDNDYYGGQGGSSTFLSVTCTGGHGQNRLTGSSSGSGGSVGSASDSGSSYISEFTDTSPNSTNHGNISISGLTTPS